MQIEKIHHVAYRCKDANVTALFYKRVLNMDLLGAAAEDMVPSTREPDPYMNIFLDAGGGNILAFFEVPNSPPMQRDPNTPAWLQHIAFQVRDLHALTEEGARRGGRPGGDRAGGSRHLPIDLLFRSQRASPGGCRMVPGSRADGEAGRNQHRNAGGVVEDKAAPPQGGVDPRTRVRWRAAHTGHLNIPPAEPVP
jgi:catechol 2,3-dioxygenase-like lactoylglutathione lyase family enzyme